MLSVTRGYVRRYTHPEKIGVHPKKRIQQAMEHKD